jgi:hypothetical protein
MANEYTSRQKIVVSCVFYEIRVEQMTVATTPREKNVTAATNTHGTAVAARVVLYAVRVASKKSRRLVLRSSCIRLRKVGCCFIDTRSVPEQEVTPGAKSSSVSERFHRNRRGWQVL